MNCPKLLLLLYGCLLTITTLNCCLCIASSSNCFETERLALVQFKQHLTDPSNRLASWVGNDCCRWAGIVCNNFTGHVTKIKLANPYNDDYEQHLLGGMINPSLLNLKHLRHLDLSYNNFNNSPIPSFIGSITSLRYLNLSHSHFGGKIPHQLGNLTRIRHLDLGFNDDGLSSYNLQWVTGLVSLQYLDMSGVNLSRAIGWVHVTSMLPSLLELRLSGCQLRNISTSITSINFTSLSALDLSDNNFDFAVPGWVFTLPRLVSLNIGWDSFVGSPLPSSLQNMTSLKVFRNSQNDYLQSDNQFSIPNWFYSLTHLEVIDLDYNNMQGVIKREIGNLTSLISLNLEFNQLEGEIPLSLGKLSNLRELVLSDNQFAKMDIGKFLKSFTFQKLEMLELDSCNFNGHLPYDLSHFPNLAYLILSRNSISGPIPPSIGRLSNLKELDLSQNSISGPIPPSIGRLSNLEQLVLSNNSISGLIPPSIGRLSNLEQLDLSDNQLNGTLPESIGQLKMLESLGFSNNLMKGVVTDLHFANLTRLEYLWGYGNKLSWNHGAAWFPPFQLRFLELSDWQLGPRFPSWLQYQNRLVLLDMANTGISGFIPTWLKKVRYLDLSSNNFTGPLPTFDKVHTMNFLDLSNNSFSGQIHHFLCNHIKDEDGAMSEYINIGTNLLSGSIPDCLEHWQSLSDLKLNNNNFSGNIPNSIGYLKQLYSLHLRNNHLSGELPRSLQNCTSLQIVDLSWNQFTGKIPTWVGNNLSRIALLNLHSNWFHGEIPNELCHLQSLQILDLANNSLSGLVPKCFSNFSAMIDIDQSSGSWIYDYIDGGYYTKTVTENGFLVIKGRESEYSSTMDLVTTVDLSSNNFSGKIPEELTRLVGLRFLNLSSNQLSGIIPVNIGNVSLLESLDLSLNHLSGKIPSSMSSLTFLNTLNLSHNNLTGQIPTSTQLQSLDESCFAYNKLCGPPLAKCNSNRTVPKFEHGNKKEDDHGDEYGDLWFIGSIALGFIVSFWVVMGPLIVSRSWRITYFGAFDSVWYKLSDFVFRCRRFFSNK